MKKITYWFLCLFLLCGASYSLMGQNSVEIENEKAGGLAELLKEHQNIEDLIISGEMNGKDFAAVRQLGNVKNLDLANVTIVAGEGYHAGYEDIVAVANEFPGYFCFDAPITTSIERIIFPKSATHIGKRAMQNAEKLKEIEWPEELTHIGELSFGYCNALSEVELPESVIYLGASAFSYCAALKGIALPEKLSFIGGSAFKKSPLLRKIEIPEGVDTIRFSTFEGCVGLEEVSLSPYTRLIENYAFSGCTGLTDIKLPSLLRELGRDSFKNCKNLSQVIFQGQGLQKIGDQAFQNCEALTELILPASVKYIGGNAFLQCTSLEKVQLPARLEVLMGGAFAQTAIKEVRLPDTLKEIKYAAFGKCANLERIRLGSDIRVIGESAFGQCPNLVTLEIRALTPPVEEKSGDLQGLSDLTALKDLSLYVPQGTLEKYQGAQGWKEFANIIAGKELTLTISEENGVENQLSDREDLREITSLTLIGPVGEAEIEQVAENLPLLCRLDLSQATIGESFSLLGGWKTIEEVLLPETYTEVGNSVFAGAVSLKKVKLSSKTQKIGEETFMNCIWLEEIELPNSIQELGESAFTGCASLKKIALPTDIEIIPDYLFQECGALEEISIGEKMTDIGSFAFFNNLSLKKIYFPQSVSELKEFSFFGCDALREIISKNPTPPTVTETSFDPKHYAQAKVWVASEEAKAEYLENETWGLFSQYEIITSVESISAKHQLARVINLPQSVRIINLSDTPISACIYNIMGQKIAEVRVIDQIDYTLSQGAYLIQIEKSSYKAFIL